MTNFEMACFIFGCLLPLVGAILIGRDKMSYWDNICEIQKRQTEKGIRTYGMTLEQNTALTDIERLEYLEEELIDGLMYIEHIKAGLKNT